MLGGKGRGEQERRKMETVKPRACAIARGKVDAFEDSAEDGNKNSMREGDGNSMADSKGPDRNDGERVTAGGEDESTLELS